MFPFVFIASGGGAILYYLPAEVLKPLIIVILTLVIIYTVFKKDWGSVRTFTSLTIGKAIILVILFSILGFMMDFRRRHWIIHVVRFINVWFDFLSAAEMLKF